MPRRPDLVSQSAASPELDDLVSSRMIPDLEQARAWPCSGSASGDLMARGGPARTRRSSKPSFESLADSWRSSRHRRHERTTTLDGLEPMVVYFDAARPGRLRPPSFPLRSVCRESRHRPGVDRVTVGCLSCDSHRGSGCMGWHRPSPWSTPDDLSTTVQAAGRDRRDRRRRPRRRHRRRGGPVVPVLPSRRACARVARVAPGRDRITQRDRHCDRGRRRSEHRPRGQRGSGCDHRHRRRHRRVVDRRPVDRLG